MRSIIFLISGSQNTHRAAQFPDVLCSGSLGEKVINFIFMVVIKKLRSWGNEVSMHFWPETTPNCSRKNYADLETTFSKNRQLEHPRQLTTSESSSRPTTYQPLSRPYNPVNVTYGNPKLISWRCALVAENQKVQFWIIFNLFFPRCLSLPLSTLQSLTWQHHEILMDISLFKPGIGEEEERVFFQGELAVVTAHDSIFYNQICKSFTHFPSKNHSTGDIPQNKTTSSC